MDLCFRGTVGLIMSDYQRSHYQLIPGSSTDVRELDLRSITEKR